MSVTSKFYKIIPHVRVCTNPGLWTYLELDAHLIYRFHSFKIVKGSKAWSGRTLLAQFPRRQRGRAVYVTKCLISKRLNAIQ